MSRLFMLAALSVLIMAGGCARWRQKELATPPPLDLGRTAAPGPGALAPAKPLNPEPEYLKAANGFLDAWWTGDFTTAYGLLSDRLRALMTEADFKSQVADLKLSAAEPVAYAGAGAVGYVIAKVTLARAVDNPPIAGYSLLLKKSAGQWRVALFLAEEKLAGKYNDLTILPSAKGKGYVVSYTDDQGNQNRSDLQEP